MVFKQINGRSDTFILCVRGCSSIILSYLHLYSIIMEPASEFPEAREESPVPHETRSWSGSDYRVPFVQMLARLKAQITTLRQEWTEIVRARRLATSGTGRWGMDVLYQLSVLCDIEEALEELIENVPPTVV